MRSKPGRSRVLIDGPHLRRAFPVGVDRRVVSERLTEHPNPINLEHSRNLTVGASDIEMVQYARAAHHIEAVVWELEPLAVHHAELKLLPVALRVAALDRPFDRNWGQVDADDVGALVREVESTVPAGPAADLERAGT